MKKAFLIITVLCTTRMFSCKNNGYKIYNGLAQGTTYRIIAQNAPHDIEQQIADVFQRADSLFSIFNPNSVISRINRNENRLIDDEIASCLMIASDVYSLSGGAYDVTVKPIVDAWGFGSGRKNPSAEYIDSLMQFVGFDKLDFQTLPGVLRKQRSGVQIDLSSIAKGYTVDMMSRMLRKNGIKNFLVEIGGEIYCHGVNSKGRDWIVGIDMPINGNGMLDGHAVDKLQAVLSLSGKAVATSGNYRNFYVDDNGNKIVHTINPKTGRPVNSNVLSVTVLSGTCAYADAIATALMAAGGLQQVKDMVRNMNTDIAYYVIYSDEDGFFKTYNSPSFDRFIIEKK